MNFDGENHTENLTDVTQHSWPQLPPKHQQPEWISPFLCQSPKWLFQIFSFLLKSLPLPSFGYLTSSFMEQIQAFPQEVTHLLPSNLYTSLHQHQLSTLSFVLKWKMCLSSYSSSNLALVGPVSVAFSRSSLCHQTLSLRYHQVSISTQLCPSAWKYTPVFIFKRKEANLHHWPKIAFHLHFSTFPHSRTSQKHPFPQQLFTSPSPTFYLLTLQTCRFSVRVISITMLSNLVASSLLFFPAASDKLKHSWPEMLGMLWVSTHSALYFQGKRQFIWALEYELCLLNLKYFPFLLHFPWVLSSYTYSSALPSYYSIKDKCKRQYCSSEFLIGMETSVKNIEMWKNKIQSSTS